jgi:hypothetical protein
MLHRKQFKVKKRRHMDKNLTVFTNFCTTFSSQPIVYSSLWAGENKIRQLKKNNPKKSHTQ